MDSVFKDCMTHVQHGCVSDPAGMAMYRKVGERREGGRVLPIWKTLRSNSQLEVRVLEAEHAAFERAR
jgi:hypothetical protein